MMTKNWKLIASLALLGALAAPALGQEKGVALKQDDIKAEPFKDAKTIGTLRKGDSVVLLKKQAGWQEITAAPGKGWVRVLSVRKGASGGNAAAEISGVAGVATGRAGTGQVVGTTGVRGLGEEDLKSARFSEEELKKAESAAVTGNDARQFAAKGELAGRTVPWLPAPQAVTANGGR
jgi:uncharacterized protein YgiM (DUF1202 family)